MEWRWQVMLFFISVSVCGQTESQSPDNLEPITQRVNEFGYRLLVTMMKRSRDSNVVLGPTSVSGVLAMALLGSVGETYDQIASALGFSQDILENRQNHEQLGELLRTLVSNFSSPQSRFASALVVDSTASPRALYQDFLRRVYHGVVLPVNFSDGAKAKDTINEWVREQTAGAVPRFLAQPLPPGSRAALLSALLFRGQWAQPFAPEFTKPMTFSKRTGDVMAELMLNSGRFNYLFSEEYGCHMVALPYNNSYTMYVLKPRLPKTLSLTTLLQTLDWATINKLTQEMKNETTIIRFPKMQLKTSVDLKEPLQALGVEAMFQAGRANFALLIDGSPRNQTEELLMRLRNGEEPGLRKLLERLPNPGVHIDTLLHNVLINIDEFGTEAVAVAAGFLARSANVFYADSPFLFFIREETSGLVTFSAVIQDPVETS